MRRIVLVLAMFMALTHPAYSQSTIIDRDEESLEQLSKKIARMKRNMDSFMKELTSTYSDQLGASGLGSPVRIDVAETPKDFVVTADLPGMDKDKIVITLDNNRILKISGSRELVREERAPNIVKQERAEGMFERIIELPAECKNEGILASYKNGVLEITIPKREETKTKTVTVNVL